MPILAAITLRSHADWRRLVDLVRPLAGPAAQHGTPLRVVVAEQADARRSEQNRFMWAGVLEQVAAQVFVGGRQFNAETWHELLKRECLPERCAKGVEKWEHHNDGTRSLRMSTADLDDVEFGQYLLAIQGHAAAEWGVVFNDRDEA